MLNEKIENNANGGYKFIGPDNPVKKALEKVFSTIAPDLDNKFVAILFDSDDKYLTEAIQMLKNDPKTYLIIAVTPGKTRDEKILQELTQSPRIKIGNLTNVMEILQTAVEFKNTEETNGDIDPAILAGSIEVKHKALRIFQHDLKAHVIAEKGEKYTKIINEARKTLGFNPEVSDQEIEEFILFSRENIEETMRNEIEGVFTDFDGTLILDDGSLNEKVVNILKEYATAGKKITIWTGGNTKRAAEKLEALGDSEDVLFLKSLEIVSKYDFAGATAEIIIDDMPQESFRIEYKIRAKKYIKV